VFRKKKLNFSHLFFKKKKKLNITTVEHGSEQWSHAPLFLKITNASPILWLGSKNQWALPNKIKFVSFTKHKNVWLRVNLTRSRNNKQHLWERLGTRLLPKILKFFFLLKFNMVYMFWIVLIC
jgi:hypothetical protein